MLILAVTHPDSISRNPRSLSEGGRQQAVYAARRFRELLGKRILLATVVSSPAARCLETAIIVAREFGETTREDGLYGGRIQVLGDLAEKSGGPNGPDILRSILETVAADLDRLGGNRPLPDEAAVLLASHGDLANMLCASTLSGSAQPVRFVNELTAGGWFEVRPVLSAFDYQQGKVIMKFCEALRGGVWLSCIHDR